jgi:hypothetical protein
MEVLKNEKLRAELYCTVGLGGFGESTGTLGVAGGLWRLWVASWRVVISTWDPGGLGGYRWRYNLQVDWGLLATLGSRR